MLIWISRKREPSLQRSSSLAKDETDTQRSKKTVANLEEVVERSKEIKTRTSQLSEEKTQLGDSRTAISEFASSIVEVSTQSRAICKESQALEILYVQEQIKANHWLSEIGRIKNWSSDFEYANTREEILQILGHLALGLYELTKSKDTETDGAVGSDKRVLEYLAKGISTTLEAIAVPKTSASRNSAMTIHGDTEFLQTSVKPVDSCALLCAKT